MNSTSVVSETHVPTLTPQSPPPPSVGRSRPAGLYALTNRYSNSGDYGAPLLDGCAWATWVSQCQNLTVYGNGSSFGNSGCGPPFGCTFGPEFQCTQLVQRYAHYAWGEPDSWYGYGGVGGNGADMWISGQSLPIPLQAFANGQGTPPQRGDVMVFGPGWLGNFWDGAGHVAVVLDTGTTSVDIAEQNATPSGTDRLPLVGSLVVANGYTPVTGWLRNTIQTPVALPASNVAGAPQTVSDQSGDVDVVWRGTDNRLWTIGYRNGHWAAQATAISAANVVGDPSLVASGAGKLDAFWQGSDGNLWHVAYQGGWFGSGSWLAAESLGVGGLQSAPHAAASGGAISVAWKGPGGTAYVDRYLGGSTGATALASGALGGDPYPVDAGGGATDVFWRDPAGNLWLAQLVSWGAGPAQRLGASGVASDPAPVSAGDGNVDVFWRGGDGMLWHLGLSSGTWGSPGQLSTQALLGRPSAVEPSPGTITLVLQRGDGNLAAVLGLPSIGWVGPELLGDGPVGSDPSAVAYGGTATSVFWRGQNGGLWSSAACPGCTSPAASAITPLH